MDGTLHVELRGRSGLLEVDSTEDGDLGMRTARRDVPACPQQEDRPE